ncbi:hypothetical protein DRN62_02600 [Nanoarchaeota archaeon]|nr:MAG: hypothetical protein DRN62_02600 [Nanoarchaeota archaeon]
MKEKKKNKELEDFRKKFLKDLRETLKRWRKEDEEYWRKHPEEKRMHEEILRELKKERKEREERDKRFLASLTPEQKRRRRDIMKKLRPLFYIFVHPNEPPEEREKAKRRAGELMESLLKKYSVEEILEVLTEDEKKKFMERYERYEEEGIAYGLPPLF